MASRAAASLATVGVAVAVLQREFGLRWQDAEKIIADHLGQQCRRGWFAWLRAAVLFLCMLWITGGVRWCFPHAPSAQIAAWDLLALLVLAFVSLFLPRLLATDAILEASRRASTMGNPSLFN